MKVVNLHQKSSDEVVAVLEDMLKDARSGAIWGLVAVVKTGPHTHQALVAGDYQRHPEQALQGVFRVERHLRADISHG